jgi:hypothetical protein
MIKIQATFSGYGGRPCTLFSAIDPETNVLAISAIADYRPERREDCIVITNVNNIPRDSLFSESDMLTAISAFYSLKAGVAADNASPRLVISDRAAQANPESSIEKDGIDGTGSRYRISDSVTCSQVAALATCLYASNAETIESAVTMMEDLESFMTGDIITI